MIQRDEAVLVRVHQFFSEKHFYFLMVYAFSKIGVFFVLFFVVVVVFSGGVLAEDNN